MFKKRELLWILLGIALMTLILMFQKNDLVLDKWADYLIMSVVILLVSIMGKKITANILDTEVEISILQFRKWWITRKSYFTKPVPIGIFVPLVLSFLSSGFIRFFTIFQFSAEALPSKVTKKYGIDRFSSMTEWHYALIVFYSTIAVWILAIVSALIASHYDFNFPFIELARVSFYFSIANLIPFGQLDGMKLVMGSRPLTGFTIFLLIITILILSMNGIWVY